jgi:endonuclease/exonuclease/phosphatase family metal-dependent hydrolase
MSYRIGSFNTLNFSGRTEKDVDIMANIITGEDLDIIALQEILRPEALTMLLRRLPYHWEGRQASPRSGKSELEYAGEGAMTGSMNPQRSANVAKGYAFLWNTRRVRECSPNGPQIFQQIRNGELVRNPFYGRFTPAGLPGGAFFEIRLINVHLCSPAENKAARMKEYKLIAEEVHTRISKKRYGENMPAYTIVLGDYNMPMLWCHENLFSSDRQVVFTEQEEKTTLAKQDSSEQKTGMEDAFANDYDHFSYDMVRFEDIPLKIERINAVEKYYRNDFVNYRKQVSDHVPIKMEVELNGGY